MKIFYYKVIINMFRKIISKYEIIDIYDNNITILLYIL